MTISPVVLVLWSIFCVMIGALAGIVGIWWVLASGRREVRSYDEVMDDWKGLRP